MNSGGGSLHMRLGEGSAWHMMRFLGHHRRHLNRAIGRLVGGEVTGWLDFHFRPDKRLRDGERTGLDFIEDEGVLAAWRDYWPQTGTAHNWDAVGKVAVGGVDHWLLAEAKAHLGEVISETGAGETSRKRIDACFQETRRAMGVTDHGDWFKPYYQYANRLAMLHFLRTQDVPAKLLMVYFVGDGFAGQKCPPTDEGWQETIDKMDAHLGLKGDSDLERSVHKLFLHVDGSG